MVIHNLCFAIAVLILMQLVWSWSIFLLIFRLFCFKLCWPSGPRCARRACSSGTLFSASEDTFIFFSFNYSIFSKEFQPNVNIQKLASFGNKYHYNSNWKVPNGLVVNHKVAINSNNRSERKFQRQCCCFDLFLLLPEFVWLHCALKSGIGSGVKSRVWSKLTRTDKKQHLHVF